MLFSGEGAFLQVSLQWGLVIGAAAEVLMMTWNDRFDFDQPQFHFFEVFAGCGAASREWCQTYFPYLPNFWPSKLLRKRRGFNVAQFERDHANDRGMDFLETPGFLSGTY